VESGEQVIIIHNKKKVACLKPVQKTDWREKIPQKPKLLVPPDEFVQPVSDIWEDYV
jgi:antitoxin (DNA-binding transcriptional repressor) of toxin-antitoxin stability system